MSKSRFPVREFEELTRKNPQWSTWVCFCETVWKRDNLNLGTITKYFSLVDKDDYNRGIKQDLINYSFQLSRGIIL